MKLLSFIILLISIYFTLSVEFDEKSETKIDNEFPIENNIMILTDTTFEKAISKYENIFAVFYAPWCSYCKKLLPELEKTASILSKENIIVAKIDSTKETKISNKYKIISYPTLKFFKENTQIKYSGKRDENSMTSWAREKSLFSIVNLKKLEDIENFKKNNDVAVIFFGKEEKDLKLYRQVAFKNFNISFAIVEDEKLAQMYKAVFNSVALFKKFDEKRNDIYNFDYKKLKKFIKKNSKRNILDLDEKNINLIFNHHIPALIYFGRKDDLFWNENQKILEKVALNIDTKLKFIMTEINDDYGKIIAEKIKLRLHDIPCIMILDVLGNINKYKYEGGYNYKDIILFIEKWEKGILNKYIISQPEPKVNNGNVFILVGNTFNEEVLQNDDDVIVLFYSPINNENLRMIKFFEEVANKLNVQNPDLIFAKIDMLENEVASFIIRDLPTIKFFPGNKKRNAPFEYRGGKKMDDIIKFIKKHSFHEFKGEDEFSGDL